MAREMFSDLVLRRRDRDYGVELVRFMLGSKTWLPASPGQRSDRGRQIFSDFFDAEFILVRSSEMQTRALRPLSSAIKMR
jgi:hypothetical protein